MSKKRVYLTPLEAEAELEKARKEIGFCGKLEAAAVKTMVETAKQNGKFGDKILIVLSPVYIHIPKWQRKLYLPRAISIGNNYEKHKWEVPKILYHNDQLICVDGMHRIYGSFLGKLDSVTIEIITDMSEQEAINLFLDQGSDRKNMSPTDIYSAALAAEKKEYLILKKICDKNHVQVKGDINPIKNPVGILTSLSDGISLARYNPELLNKILALINKLQWNGGKGAYMGKAYSAKVLRVLKKLYAYYSDREDMLETILLNNCKGAEFFNNNLAEKYQDTLFDYLSMIIEANINIAIIMPHKSKVTKAN